MRPLRLIMRVATVCGKRQAIDKEMEQIMAYKAGLL